MSNWRMTHPCDNCPFNESGPGLALRKSLRPGRWKSILHGLRTDRHFFCHKTTRASEEEDASEVPSPGQKVCAGSLEWSEKHGVSQNFCRVMENVDWIFRDRTKEGTPS